MIGSVIPFIVAALATARITRLLTEDFILDKPRAWVQSKVRSDMLAYLITCAWCTSVYVGAGVATAGVALGWWTWWTMPLYALAFSYTAGWLASKEGE